MGPLMNNKFSYLFIQKIIIFSLYIGKKSRITILFLSNDYLLYNNLYYLIIIYIFTVDKDTYTAIGAITSDLNNSCL